jgi:hypothetical protein
MGFFDGLMGNASNTDIGTVEDEIGHIISNDERVEKAYKIIRDMIIFTNKRLIVMDVQGISGKRTSYTSIPYRNISHFTVETAGALELDAHLNIFIIGGPTITQEFKRDKTIDIVHKSLGEYVL